jgi:hypothetical protein
MKNFKSNLNLNNNSIYEFTVDNGGTMDGCLDWLEKEWDVVDSRREIVPQQDKLQINICLFVYLMVCNATFNKISVIRRIKLLTNTSISG